MNKENLSEFLASSLLEEYMLGIIDPAEIPLVEQYIREIPEVRAAYEELQLNIEQLAKKAASTPPPGTKERILNAIDEPQPSAIKPSGSYSSWFIAAALIALLLGAWSIVLHRNNSKLRIAVSELEEEYRLLKEDCADNQVLMAQRENNWIQLADPNTKALLLNGNSKASKLESVAYWNEKSQTSFLRVLSYPDIPKGKCLQLWADVDGEMVSVTIVRDENRDVVSIPFKANATSLNITIEPEGGSDHATVANLVASVPI